VLKEEGIVHLKTDSRPLMDFTVESVEAFGGNILALTHDLYNSIYKSVHFGIKTHYETLFSEKGFSINYCRFKLPVLPEPLGPPDPIYTDNGDLKIFP
jgi:tRNA (guanine-N7-)-methyltransferase